MRGHFHIAWSSLAFMATVVFYLACQSRPEVEPEALLGRWKVGVAERNGKRSEYLDRGYFHFEKGGHLVVNLTGAEESGTYTLDERTVQMTGYRDYFIEKQAQDSLFVRFNISPESEFRVILIRDEASAQ